MKSLVSFSCSRIILIKQDTSRPRELRKGREMNVCNLAGQIFHKRATRLTGYMEGLFLDGGIHNHNKNSLETQSVHCLFCLEVPRPQLSLSATSVSLCPIVLPFLSICFSLILLSFILCHVK